jgi:hypothetical protein
VFEVQFPDGGERLVPTDTATIVWTSMHVPAALGVTLEFSSNNGGTWSTIQSGITSRNLPDTNKVAWVIPDAPGNATRVRVALPSPSASNITDAPFTVALKPAVELLTLNDGGRLFAGEEAVVRWSTVNTQNVRLEYSLDGGATWQNLLLGNKPRVGASLMEYPWEIPVANASAALVRVVNDERTRFVDVSEQTFEVVIGELDIMSPGAGSKYELGEAVTVTYHAPHSTRLRLDYSTDGGTTWLMIADDVDAATGSYTFTPNAIPTRRALVRLTDETREDLSAVSDAMFEIMEARGISVFSPAQGEEIMRGSVYPITWQSTRIARVNIEYSAQGGAPGTWTRVATDVSAGVGSYSWNVPTAGTATGLIRIVEVGGNVIGTSGEFSIVSPVAGVRLIRPNGGEVYTAGDEIIIGWSSSNVTSISLEHSSDGGASWWPIASNLAANKGTYRWTAPNEPGTGYRVKVMSGVQLSDMSDANFEVKRRIVPSLRVGYPNGGEVLTVDSTVSIGWIANDIAGDVTVSYSIDNGGTWIEIGTAPASAGALSWTVPAAVSAQALVRIVGTGGVEDVSDGVFSIEPAIIRSVALSSPNASTVVWTEGDAVTITWAAQNLGDVTLSLSTDNGATWPIEIAASVPASQGSFTYTVPRLATTRIDGALRVKVAEALLERTSDTSDAGFTYMPRGSGVDDVTTGARELRLGGLYPNPFATETELRWSQATSSEIELRVYTHAGALVRQESLGMRSAGANSARIDVALLPAGSYLYEVRSSRETVRGTMTIVR